MAKVHKMRATSGVAGQRVIDVDVEHDGAPGVDRYTFVGSVYGAPGPVVMVHGSTQSFVYHPGRFGGRFDADWVLRFLNA